MCNPSRLPSQELKRFDEDAHLVAFLGDLKLQQGHAILDVGCGFGAKLRLLGSRGFNVVGVDLNEEAIGANRAAGFECVLPKEFDETDKTYDIVLMSHIIEHFAPAELLEFMDHYLDRLKCGGHLIVITPLMWPCFYDDFDHVKPYHPEGMSSVFCADRAQVQFKARNRLKLQRLAFRRTAFRVSRTSWLQSGRGGRALCRIMDWMLGCLYLVSGGFISRANGWVGLFQKVSQDAGGKRA